MAEFDIIRTAAIVYADESQVVNSNTLKRRMIEAVIYENGNKEITLDDLIDHVQKSLTLVFEESEIKEIINKAKKGYFEVRNATNGKDIFVKLTDKRVAVLEKRERERSIDKYIEDFVSNKNTGKLGHQELNNCLHQFCYELLNKNINAFNKIIHPSNVHEEIAVNPDLFTVEQRMAINEFLSWDSVDKNKALFTLISYCIEYSLITNNLDDAQLLKSLRTKEFYLDNNIIYRAIGINGDLRQKRITEFLQKCLDSGQKLFVSKFTIKEFQDTIDHHIKQLQRVPFGRINPNLFSKYCVNPSIYGFYHQWRNSRTTYSFDLFSVHITGLFKEFVKKYGITEDYKIPYDESSKESVAKIENLKDQIAEAKPYGFEDSHYYDAKNIYFVEQKRGENKISITDTKYYFVSTDQKLRAWDFSRSDFQPIALLPSQWLGVILKYISRTDNDFKSFTSFLRLKQDVPHIQEDNLQAILSGISEITDDFGRQEAVIDKMFEVKFHNELKGKQLDDIRKESFEFAKNELENELESVKSKSLLDIRSHKENLLREIEQTLQDMTKSKIPLDNQAAKSFRFFKFKNVGAFVLYYLLLVFLVAKIGWNTMEPITWIMGFGGLVISYIYIAVMGQSFNPTKYYQEQESKIVLQTYQKFNFNLERFHNLMKERETLKNELGS